MSNYKELEVWQASRLLAIEVYKLTDQGLFMKDYALRDQIRRAAISIPSNIAEGDESGFNKLGIRYFYTAKASLAELKTQLDIAHATQHLKDEDYEFLSKRIISISKRLRRLIQYRLSK